MPGEYVGLDFFAAEPLYSNLDGQGPDVNMPDKDIRFYNVGYLEKDAQGNPDESTRST